VSASEELEVRMAKGVRVASHEEVVFNVVLSALILITGIERLRTGQTINLPDPESVKELEGVAEILKIDPAQTF
jgi:hypothetical protein